MCQYFMLYLFIRDLPLVFREVGESTNREGCVRLSSNAPAAKPSNSTTIS
jgi:hypothetical protein